MLPPVAALLLTDMRSSHGFDSMLSYPSLLNGGFGDSEIVILDVTKTYVNQHPAAELVFDILNYTTRRE